MPVCQEIATHLQTLIENELVDLLRLNSNQTWIGPRYSNLENELQQIRWILGQSIKILLVTPDLTM